MFGSSQKTPATADPGIGQYPGWLVPSLYLLMGIAALYPLAVVTVPPLVDYPNHLARMHILASYADSPELQQNYVIRWRPVPNLAMDAIVPWLGRIVPIYDAGRLFVGLSIVTVVGGTCALHRAVHGRLGFWPAISFLVTYNLSLGWGFLNFYFGVGLFLLAFAGWIASERWRGWGRPVIFAIMALLLFFAHLIGFLAYGLSVILYEASKSFGRGDLTRRALARRWSAGLGQFVLPIGFLVIGAVQSGGAELDDLIVAPGIWYGDGFAKLTAIFSPFLLYGDRTDFAVIIFVIIGLFLALLLKWITLGSTLRSHVIAFFALTLALPHVFHGVWVDSRVAFIAICLVIAATRIEPRAGQAAVIPLSTAVVALFVLKVWAVAKTWQFYDGHFAEFRRATAVIEPGTRLLSVQDTGPQAKTKPGESEKWYMATLTMMGSKGVYPPYRNLAPLAVIERSVFLPSMFTFPFAQPLQSAPSRIHLDPIRPARAIGVNDLVAGADPTKSKAILNVARTMKYRAFWVSWPQNFDYVVVFHHRDGTRDNPSPRFLEEAARGSFFSIFKVKRRLLPGSGRASPRAPN